MAEDHARDAKMLVGLISDTHDNLPMVDKTVRRLNEEKVELVLHAGDYVAGFVIPRFKDLRSKLIGVFGNNDGDHELLKKRFDEYGFEIKGSLAVLTADGLKMALSHGSDESLIQALVESGGFDVVVHGHSHNPAVYRHGKTLVVNPGEVCGYLTGRSTVGLLDTVNLEARLLEL